MINLIGKSGEELDRLLAPVVDRPFRVRQVGLWLHQRNATSFEAMTNLPRGLQRQLAESFSLAEPEVLEVAASRDGSSKYLFGLADGASVEAVTMPDGRRLTLCLSSQTGCAVGCTFCVTGVLGSGRNLSAEEIVGQYRVMRRAVDGATDRINIVFMGMGEPLLNRSGVGEALEALFETVSPKRITVSTSGIIPGIRWLARLARRPKLAVSLNAPDQERRAQVMPIAARYPLDQLMAELRRFPLEGGRRVTFEYVLIRDFNAAVADARLLARLVRGIPSKINVIPLNEDPVHLPGQRPPDATVVDAFAAAVRDAGLTVTVRWSKGRDVAGACGQLKGRRQPARTTSDH